MTKEEKSKQRRNLLFGLLIIALITFVVILIVDVQKYNTKKESDNNGLKPCADNDEDCKFQQALIIMKQIANLIGNNNPHIEGSPAYNLGLQLNALGYTYVSSTILSPVDDPNEFIFVSN